MLTEEIMVKTLDKKNTENHISHPSIPLLFYFSSGNCNLPFMLSTCIEKELKKEIQTGHY